MAHGLRLLHVTPFVVPDPALGGTPRSVCALTDALHRAGHEVTIWAGDWGDKKFWTERTETTSADVRFFKSRFSPVGSLLNTPIVPELVVPCTRSLENFDVVHMHLYWNCFTPGIARACRKSGTALVLQPHGSLVHAGQRDLAKTTFQLLFRKGIVQSTAIAVALTESERDQLLNNGFGGSQIRVVPNPSLPAPQNLPSTDEAKEQLGLSSDTEVILYLGRLHPAKGVEQLLVAFKHIKSVRSRSALVYAGPDEGMLQELRRTAEHMGIDGVKFLGPVAGTKKWLVLRAGTVFCLPSLFEAFPRAVLEAAQVGLPIVLSSRVELPYARSERAVAVSDPEPQALADVILSVLSSEKVRQELSARAKQWAESHFSPGRIVSSMEAVYGASIGVARARKASTEES